MDEIIDRFLLELSAQGISKARIYKYKNLFEMIEKCLGKKLPENNKDVLKILAYIEQSNYKYNTKITFKKALKRFLRWLNKNYNYNFSLDFKVGDYRPAVSEKDLFTEEEVQKLVNATDNIKFKFAIMFLYETGARIGEFLNMRIREIKFDKYGVKIILERKTGMRIVRVINCVPALAQWLVSITIK